MTLFLGFCQAPGCHAEWRWKGYCGRHAHLYFPPGAECAWCGADLHARDAAGRLYEPARCWNRREEAFCTPAHRSASNRALARLRAGEAN